MTIAPEGRRLLRIEQRNAETPVQRKPEWMKARLHLGPEFVQTRKQVRKDGLHTVCEEAGCPNIYECWEDKEATFLIGGSQCTRRCDFCQIDTGRPAPLDRTEPLSVAESVRSMGLRYATVTGVARDDLPDEGAWLYAETIRTIHELNPGTGVEILIPDFSGRTEHVLAICEAAPEVSEAMRDLHEAGCDLLTITQYLRPSERHHPVDRWVRPEEFLELSQEAEEIGFLGVMSGPLVRSSYRAGRLWATAMQRKGRAIPEHLAHLTTSGPARQEAAALVAERS